MIIKCENIIIGLLGRSDNREWIYPVSRATEKIDKVNKTTVFSEYQIGKYLFKFNNKQMSEGRLMKRSFF